MQIPKHLTQVGTISNHKTVYIEDYCISYVKQLVKENPHKKKQIALYGIVENQSGKECAFVLGAALISSGDACADMLKANQKQKAEEKRMEYFFEMQLIAFAVCEDSYQEKLYFIASENKNILLDGFYIFYDKNESMLNFMMAEQKIERGIDMDPVIVKKAEMDRIKVEKEKMETTAIEGTYRKQLLAERKESPEYAQKEKKKGSFSVVACCLLLAIGGVYTFKDSYTELSIGGIEEYVSGYLADFVLVEDASSDVIISVQEEPEVLQEEFEVLGESVEVEETVELPEGFSEIIIPSLDDVMDEEVIEELPEETVEAVTENIVVTTTTYQIEKGDNLLNILRTHYGDDSRLEEVCTLNNIMEPDNIQVGQTILLP